jgi:uncharacterized cupin superfamily protein
MLIHWHSAEDEFFYILQAGDDARLLINETDEKKRTREEKMKAGDFLGFPAGVKNGGALKTGSSQLIYLVGGNKKQLKVVHYPFP